MSIFNGKTPYKKPPRESRPKLTPTGDTTLPCLNYIEPPWGARLLEMAAVYGITHQSMAKTIILAALDPSGRAAVRVPRTKIVHVYPDLWLIHKRVKAEAAAAARPLLEGTTGQAHTPGDASPTHQLTNL
jgi:hypothetical protein